MICVKCDSHNLVVKHYFCEGERVLCSDCGHTHDLGISPAKARENAYKSMVEYLENKVKLLERM